MKSKQQPIDRKLPDPERISAFFDHEDTGSFDAKVFQENPSCAPVLEIYEKIGEATRKKLQQSVPEDLEKNILLKVRMEASRRRTTPFSALALRLAAGVVLVFGLGLILMNLELNPNTAKNAAGPEPERVADTTHDRAGEMAETNLNIDDLQPVSFGVTNLNIPIPKMPEKTSVTKIDDDTRQVWVVGDLKRAAAEFEKSLARVGVPKDQFKLETTAKGNRVVIAADMTKKQLVELVRDCDKMGFKLVSPAAPQPEQKMFANQGDEKVSYLADLVAE